MINSIKIPKSVQQIGQCSFKNCKNIKSVQFEENSELCYINNNAFSDSSLEIIEIPPHVQQINEFTFHNCKNLKTVKFDENSELNSIDNNAFSDSSLETIEIPSHVQQINESAFQNCQKLETVKFGKNSELFLINSSAFKNTSLKEITIPSNVRIISSFAFKDCNILRSIKFEENSELKSIGSSAFENTQIYSIKIPRHVKTIKEYTFKNCSRLSLVEFDQNSELYSMRYQQFDEYQCNNKLIIPKNLAVIDDKNFKNYFYSTIEISPENKHFKIANDELLLYRENIDDDFDTLVYIFHENKNYYFYGTVIIPSTVRKIRKYAFDNFKNFSLCLEISKGSKMNFIQNNIFDLIKVHTLIIPFLLIKIRSYLKNYHNITRIALTDDDFQIDNHTFSGLKNLQVISLPYAKTIKIDCDCKLTIFRTLSSEIEGKNLWNHKILEISDTLLCQNHFPSESDEIKYYQSKEQSHDPK